MADIKSPEKRSQNMSHIRGKDTKIEVKVRSYLFRQGFRFRKNVRKLPGTPDIVLPKYKTVIFVHGCFWHQHPFCKEAHIPKTREDYWVEKLDRNVEKDKKNYQKLEELGWKVIVIWECELEKKHFESTMQRVMHEINSVIEDI